MLNYWLLLKFTHCPDQSIYSFCFLPVRYSSLNYFSLNVNLLIESLIDVIGVNYFDLILLPNTTKKCRSCFINMRIDFPLIVLCLIVSLAFIVVCSEYLIVIRLCFKLFMNVVDVVRVSTIIH
jgi:hypothetical protein